MQGNPSATSDTSPLAVYPQTDDRGRPWVELVITNDAAVAVAHAVARRLQGNHLARSVSSPALVALISGAITDTGISMTTQECDDLAHHLADAAAQATSPELAEAVR